MKYSRKIKYLAVIFALSLANFSACANIETNNQATQQNIQQNAEQTVSINDFSIETEYNSTDFDDCSGYFTVSNDKNSVSINCDLDRTFDSPKITLINNNQNLVVIATTGHSTGSLHTKATVLDAKTLNKYNPPEPFADELSHFSGADKKLPDPQKIFSIIEYTVENDTLRCTYSQDGANFTTKEYVFANGEFSCHTVNDQTYNEREQ